MTMKIYLGFLTEGQYKIGFVDQYTEGTSFVMLHTLAVTLIESYDVSYSINLRNFHNR